MTRINSTARTQLERAADALLRSLIETDRFGTILGPLLAACGVGLLFKRTVRTTAMVLGSLLFLYTLVFSKCRNMPRAPAV
jgi:hypothetical protein